MGAETRVFVKVLRLVEGYVEVSALTTQDGMDKAAKLPGVARVVEAQYEPFAEMNWFHSRLGEI